MIENVIDKIKSKCSRVLDSHSKKTHLGQLLVMSEVVDSGLILFVHFPSMCVTREKNLTILVTAMTNVTPFDILLWKYAGR